MSAAEDYSKYKHKSLIVSGLGTFMGTLDSSITNVSLPTISRDLQTTIELVGWVILAYGITLFSLLMIFGVVSEKKGYQFSYKYGFAAFMIGSILSGLSPNIYFLIASRVLQGIGAALLIAVGPALITRSFPVSERGRGLSIIAMVVSVGLMLGPPLGGFIIGLAGWRWIFFVNVPVCIFGLYFTFRYIGDFPITDPHKKISIGGVVSLSMGLLLLMAALLLYSRQVSEMIFPIGVLLISFLAFGLFFYFESKPETRLIGLDIFRNRVFTFSGSAMLLVFISSISVTVLIPFYLEEIKNLKPHQVGLFLMVIPVCSFFIAPLAGYLSDKIQAVFISSFGALLMAAGIYLVKGFLPGTSLTSIGVAILVIGIGMAFFGTPNTSAIMGSVKKYQLGSASGILATIRTLGISLGVGFSVEIFSFYRDSYSGETLSGSEPFIYGYHSVYQIILFVIILAVIFSLVRGKNLNKAT